MSAGSKVIADQQQLVDGIMRRAERAYEAATPYPYEKSALREAVFAALWGKEE